MKFWIGVAIDRSPSRSARRSAVVNEYFFFAGYIVLQFVILATAWNILGGYAGYVNFGTAGFFALGAYTAVVLYQVGSARRCAVQIAAAAAGRAGCSASASAC